MPPATPSESFDTPSIPASEAVFIAHSKTEISAPASLVFRTLRNTETWRDWNPWVPRVVVTYQTPDEDTATAEEIAELVRNTSIAGSYDSDLTDGIVGGGTRRKSAESDRPPDTPPLKLRSKSNASAWSDAPVGRSNSEVSEMRGTSSPQTLAVPTQTSPKVNGGNTSNNNTSGSGTVEPKLSAEPRLSAAQKYAAAQESRRSSVKSGESIPAVSSNVLVHDPFLSPSSYRSPSQQTSDTTGAGPGSPRRKSTSLAVERARAKANERMLLQLYGEPSVRIQLDTKMTFFIRMNPRIKSEYKQQQIVVTHVSRPADPATDLDTNTNPDSKEVISPLTRSKTHTLSETFLDGSSPVYRIIWTIDSTKSSISAIKNGSSFPKSLYQMERVHEIRPLGHNSKGEEQCEYRSWECHKGPMAKFVVSKKLAGYVQVMFERWGTGLKEFCEGLVGNNVERRDFSVDFTNNPNQNLNLNLSASPTTGVGGLPSGMGLGMGILSSVVGNAGATPNTNTDTSGANAGDKEATTLPEIKESSVV